MLWAGDGAVASHVTAAGLYGFDLSHDKPHITVPPSRAPKSPLVVVHRGLITSSERRTHGGVPVTSPAITLLGIAGMLTDEELEAAVEDFLHRGLVTATSIGKSLAGKSGKGHAGSARLRRALTQRGDRSLESKLEVKVWRLLRRHGLRPVRQYEVRIGTKWYRLDFAWPTLKVAVEAEGWSAHGARPKFDPDRDRLGDLVASGWAVIPVTWKACTQTPEVVVAKIRAALVNAAA